MSVVLSTLLFAFLSSSQANAEAKPLVIQEVRCIQDLKLSPVAEGADSYVVVYRRASSALDDYEMLLDFSTGGGYGEFVRGEIKTQEEHEYVSLRGHSSELVFLRSNPEKALLRLAGSPYHSSGTTNMNCTQKDAL